MDRSSSTSVVLSLLILIALTAGMILTTAAGARLSVKPRPGHLLATTHPCTCRDCLRIRADHERFQARMAILEQQSSIAAVSN